MRKNEQGIALIIVLGFLAILLVMAVTLTTSLRTERLAAETAKDDTRVRQLVQSALAGALDDVDFTMNNINPESGSVELDSTPRPVSIHLPKQWAVFKSLRSSGQINVGTLSGFGLFSGEAANWIPRKYLSADPQYDAVAIANTAQWVPVIDPATDVLLGRYGYVLVDCSGLIDANRIHSQQTPVRGRGTSVGEINAGYLPEVEFQERAEYLIENRSYYHFFGSLPEIMFLNDGVGAPLGYSEKDAVTSNLLNNLVAYSLCYDKGWWEGSPNPRWRNTGPGGAPLDVRQWTRDNAEDAFAAVGYDAAGMAPAMADCFQDYMDSDFLPGIDVAKGSGSVNTEIPCGEPIPMINEYVVSHKLELDNTVLRYSINFDVELWYPFLGVTNLNEYRVTLNAPTFDIIAAMRNPAGGAISIDLDPTPNDPPLGQVCLPDQISISAVPEQAFGRMVGARTTYVFERDLGAVPIPGNYPIQVRIRRITGLDAILADLTAGTSVVDHANAQSARIEAVNIQLQNGQTLVEPPNRWAVAVNDPRLNHEQASWDTPAATWLAFNTPTAGAATNEGVNMYVRNSTNIESVAELGFIPTGQPWTTVDLFSRAGAHLLAGFRTGATNAAAQYVSGFCVYTNGPINPNTLNPEVLAAAFQDTPVERFPGDTALPMPRRVDQSLASRLGQRIVTYSENETYWGTNDFVGPADWATVPSLVPSDPLWANLAVNNNNNCKESVIRNSYRLFNPNQNLFTIVVVAQSINDQGTKGAWDSDVDVITGEKRAVAIVWRDPFPNANNRHEMFVKMFRWLD